MKKLALILFISSILLGLACKKSTDNVSKEEEEKKASLNQFYKYQAIFPNQDRNAKYFNGAKVVSKNVLFISAEGQGDDNKPHALLMAYKSDSTFLFIKKLEMANANLIDMVPDGVGGIILYGNRRPNFYEHYPFVARFNASGELLWSKSFMDTQLTFQNVGQGIFYERSLSQVVNEKVALFCGTSTLLLDVNGNLLWRAITNGYAGFLDDSGVTIFAERSVSKAFVIKKLNYSGSLLWAKSAPNEQNAAMAFGDPIVLNNNNVILPYIHKTIATRIPSYGLLNLTKDGIINSNRQYAAAAMNINVETRPYEIYRKADGKIWMHVASVKYGGAGSYSAYESGFHLNEDGTADISGFYFGEAQSFALEGNQVVSFDRDGTDVNTGNMTTNCARKNASDVKVGILNSGLNFGTLVNYSEIVTLGSATIANFPITVSNHRKFDFSKPFFCE